MKLLLDECVTRHLKRDLTSHEVYTVEEAGFKPEVSKHFEDFSRKGAKTQSAAAFLRVFFAPLRLCVRNTPCHGDSHVLKEELMKYLCLGYLEPGNSKA